MAGFWPENVDYSEAIQTPQLNLGDRELRSAQPVLDTLGPRVCSGAFAVVFQLVAADGRSWAVKCFTRRVAGLRERYRAISDHLAEADLPLTVDFQYLSEGIRIRGEWFPILKMDWVEGQTLYDFVQRNVADRKYLGRLLQIWYRVEPALRATQTVHGDLQHGNVLLVPGKSQGKLSLRLIDYDGLWTPALAQTPPGETGHAAYQHPQRDKLKLYTADIDRFPHLVIAAALKCLTHPQGKSWWKKFDNGENLLFKRQDFEAPAESPLLHELWDSGDEELQTWAAVVALAASSPLEATPLLEKRHIDGQLTRLTPAEDSAARAILGAPAAKVSPVAATESNWWNEPLSDEVVTSTEDDNLAELPSRKPKPKVVEEPQSGWGADQWVLAGAGGAVAVTLLVGLVVFLFTRGRDGSKAVVASSEPTSKSITHRTTGEAGPPLLSAPFSKEEAASGQRKWADLLGMAVEKTSNAGIKLRLIPPGEFHMGSPDSEADRFRSETLHRVRLTTPFLLGTHEVTQAEYLQVMGTNPSLFPNMTSNTMRFPVERVSWYDAAEFCNKLSSTDNLPLYYDLSNLSRENGSIRSATVKAGTNDGYRLPTEGEWEYACRAGTTTAFHFGDMNNGQQSHVKANSPKGKVAAFPTFAATSAVGGYAANAFGLHDMHGNVLEWCADWYEQDFYDNPAATADNPFNAPSGNERRVIRGGSWSGTPSGSRSACRGGAAPEDRENFIGFRVARTIPNAPAPASPPSNSPTGPIVDNRSSPDNSSSVAATTSTPTPSTIPSTSVPVATSNGQWTVKRTLTSHTDAVQSVALSRDGKTLISGSWDNSVKLWDVDTGQMRASMFGHTSQVRAVAMTPDGKSAASADKGGKVYVWEVPQGKQTANWHAGFSRINSLVFAPDNQTLMVGSADDSARSWNVTTGLKERDFQSHSQDVEGVALSPDGATLVTASMDRTVKLWDAATGRMLRTLAGHGNFVQCVAFAPDGQTLASGSYDTTIKLWAYDGSLLRTLTGHTDPVFAVVFTPDGQQLISGSYDKTVKVWDVNSGILLDTLTGHTDAVTTLALSQEGTLVSAGLDKTIRIWKTVDAPGGRTRTATSTNRSPAAAMPQIETASTSLVQLFRPGQILNYIGIPANASRGWAAGDKVMVGNREFTIESIRPANPKQSFDIVVLVEKPTVTYGTGTPVRYVGKGD